MSNNDPPTHPVIVYHKSPFVAALPWVAGLIFVTLMIYPFIESAPGPFELCSMTSVLAIFWIALLGILITNEKLGTKISVDQTLSEISVHSRGLRTEFKQDLNLKYQNSDCIVNRVRTESVRTRDGGSGTATHYEIHLFRMNRTHELIFSINGFSLSKFKAKRIAKKIAHITKLQHHKKLSEIPQQQPPSEAEGDEVIQFGTILS